ncbi:MAG TPA: glucose 1-dehydrogenase [Cytophagaceae bacterium]|jgi:NAD(P)-dependent dehydrogenase (short-subunit alcohol dehydrogenase family)
MDLTLKGKVAVITGAGSGIGKAMATLFAQKGAFVNLLDLDQKGGEETAQEITEAGGNAAFHLVNVADYEHVEKTVNNIGNIDILINNAGIAHVGNVENCGPNDFEKIYQVNVKGVYNCLHATLPIMKSQSSGVILNLASVASSIGIPDRFAYSMSKGAVLGMTLSVARDYVLNGIRCNCISPGRVHTPFVDGFIAKNYPGKEKEMFEKLSASQPIGRMGTPEEIAKLALFLCSDDAAFITGADYAIDGGFVNLKM